MRTMRPGLAHQTHVFLRVMALAGFLMLGTEPCDLQAYGPIDNLLMTVRQFEQDGQITDAAIMSNLVMNLETIAEVIDRGDLTAARSLLVTFGQHVEAITDGITSQAADQLITAARDIEQGLQ